MTVSKNFKTALKRYTLRKAMPNLCEKFMVRKHPNKKKNKDELRLIH